ncbi:nucleotide sugar dehydrogenase [Corynebacterium tuberculostearicum]|uniref:nucleotide sugar dehydrogenase n=1 Tax=Corynebacterium tuberculostearicum TaxID=38304 RepID=UPI0029344737|nr:nucleotide sugar dehydrogenase [Corynebacterium tuberculostearicum]MDV2431450.1 nucleotide sugar dehydrogenase [Corynebacterium tuberculostearicum]
MSKSVTIVGQGYVGLPLAQSATEAGWKVYGLDVSEVVVSKLNAGESHIDDLSNEDIDAMLEKGYQATTDPKVIADSEVTVICVPTPLGEAGAPDLGYVESAVATVGENLRAGALVVLESTTYPGTTEDVCVPILEAKSGLVAGRDFQVSFSPERVNPGSEKYGIKNTPKLVGGINGKSADATVGFYSTFVDEVVALSGVKEAETAKLLENTFRHVNIALVNEMARVCHELGIDIWEVIRGSSTKPFGFMKFTPGAGVGGHCIPIDPNYLSYEVRRRLGYPLRFVELAQEINNSMPEYVVDRVAEKLNSDKKAVNGSNVLILGVTYKPNIADQRESPARPAAEELIKRGANLHYFDPFVPQWNVGNGEAIERVEDLDDALQKADIVVLLQAHKAFNIEKLESQSKLFLDTCGKSAKPENRL